MDKDWIKNNGEMIKKAYSIAVKNKYNVGLVIDVLKILREIDPKNADYEFAVKLSNVLILFDKTAKVKALRKSKLN
jgi:hypothetical protein